MSATSLALSNLRAIVILIVLGFHSIMGYLGSLPSEPPTLDAPPYDWQTFPIIDSQRWFGFDLFCAWNDVCLMSLMFFLSGLFVWPSLQRKRSFTYLTDRLLRLGLPMIPAIFVLMPIALYPVYLVTAPDPSVADYWRQFQALPFWPCGPQWFLWQLLILNIVAAALHKVYPTLGRASRQARRQHAHRSAPLHLDPHRRVGARLCAAGADLFAVGLVSVRRVRVPMVPAAALRGLFLRRRRRRRLWARARPAGGRRRAGAALAARRVGAAVVGLRALDDADRDHHGGRNGNAGPLWLQLAANLGFVVCCAGGCLALMAVCIRFATNRRRWLDSLSANAYGMYLVHYPFVVWMQYALLNAPLPAIVKAAIVFAVAVALSWAHGRGLAQHSARRPPRRRGAARAGKDVIAFVPLLSLRIGR